MGWGVKKEFSLGHKLGPLHRFSIVSFGNNRENHRYKGIGQYFPDTPYLIPFLSLSLSLSLSHTHTHTHTHTLLTFVSTEPNPVSGLSGGQWHIHKYIERGAAGVTRIRGGRGCPPASLPPYINPEEMERNDKL